HPRPPLLLSLAKVCLHRSSTHGWLAAQVQHFSAEDGGEAAPAAGWDLRPQREASRATREHSLHPGGLRRGIPQRLSAQLDPGHGAAPGPGPRDLRPRLQGKGEHGTRFSSASDPAPGRARKPSGAQQVNITRLRPPADLPPSCTRGSAPVQPAAPAQKGKARRRLSEVLSVLWGLSR
ncbi:unnamed protein product, partial [Prorocentrum cordatum]